MQRQASQEGLVLHKNGRGGECGGLQTGTATRANVLIRTIEDSRGRVAKRGRLRRSLALPQPARVPRDRGARARVGSVAGAGIQIFAGGVLSSGSKI